MGSQIISGIINNILIIYMFKNSFFPNFVVNPFNFDPDLQQSTGGVTGCKAIKGGKKKKFKKFKKYKKNKKTKKLRKKIKGTKRPSRRDSKYFTRRYSHSKK